MQNVVLKIAGMSCGGCVKSVTRALDAVPGVASVQVDLASGEATIGFDADVTNAAALCAAVEDAGYDVVTA